LQQLGRDPGPEAGVAADGGHNSHVDLGVTEGKGRGQSIVDVTADIGV
jgi:hypothetical protein